MTGLSQWGSREPRKVLLQERWNAARAYLRPQRPLKNGQVKVSAVNLRALMNTKWAAFQWRQQRRPRRGQETGRRLQRFGGILVTFHVPDSMKLYFSVLCHRTALLKEPRKLVTTKTDSACSEHALRLGTSPSFHKPLNHSMCFLMEQWRHHLVVKCTIKLNITYLKLKPSSYCVQHAQ